MKTRMLLATALLLGFIANPADNFRYVTVAATHDGPATVQIQEGETAELMSSVSTTKNGTVQITFLKSGGEGGQWGFGIPVTGPATITASSSRDNTAINTVRITADSFGEKKTHSLTPVASQIYVTLESSTNLVDWADATNGVYGSADTLRVFRIRTKALASP